MRSHRDEPHVSRTASTSLEPYRGEFRYVFYAPETAYAATVDFYSQDLGFPIVGGFPRPGPPYAGGTYVQASSGVVEILRDPGSSELRDLLVAPGEPYFPPRGAFLLVEVPDVDRLAASLLGRGIELTQQPRDWPWRFRDLKVEDPCGTVVCLFSRLPGWEAHH